MCNLDISILRYSDKIVRKAKQKPNRARSAQVKALVPIGTATPTAGSIDSN